jgi:hypothetical protein
VWNPLIVGVPFAYMMYSAYTQEFTIMRTVRVGLVALWFGISVLDAVSGHEWLDWLYDEDEPPADE